MASKKDDIIRHADNDQMSEIQRPDSTTRGLELMSDDSTANATQPVDEAACTPEVDHKHGASQIYAGGIEVVSGQSWLQAPSKHSTSISIAAPGAVDPEEARPRSYMCGLPRRIFWMLLIVLCVLVVAVAIGVGVGVGVSQNKAANATAPIGFAPPAETEYQQRITVYSSSNAPAIPTSSSQPLDSTATQGILNDSSLAAVTTSNGDRHVFFQNVNGTLRQAIYTHSSSSWSAATSYTISSDAKNLTPLSAATRDDLILGSFIYLFYIKADHTLGGRVFMLGTGWLTFGSPNFTEFTNITTFKAAEDTRSLSVSVLSNTPTFEACVFFEGPNKNISVVHGTYIFEDPNATPAMDQSGLDTWSWKDLTSTLIPQTLKDTNGVILASNATFGTPFKSAMVRSTLYQYGMNTGTPPANTSFLSVNFVYRAGDDVEIMTSHYLNGTFSPGQELPVTTDLGQPRGYNFSNIVDSDIATSNVDSTTSYLNGPYTFWVNGTTLSFGIMNGMKSLPTSPFPYTRLAVTNPANSSALYLYHQVNATMIAEDVWDDAVSSWVSSNVTVATI